MCDQNDKIILNLTEFGIIGDRKSTRRSRGIDSLIIDNSPSNSLIHTILQESCNKGKTVCALYLNNATTFNPVLGSIKVIRFTVHPNSNTQVLYSLVAVGVSRSTSNTPVKEKSRTCSLAQEFAIASAGVAADTLTHDQAIAAVKYLSTVCAEQQSMLNPNKNY
jgi:hypothetical protein